MYLEKSEIVLTAVNLWWRTNRYFLLSVYISYNEIVLLLYFSKLFKIYQNTVEKAIYCQRKKIVAHGSWWGKDLDMIDALHLHVLKGHSADGVDRLL